MMSRTGKIARLPYQVRELLNTWLQNGVKGKIIVKLLNVLPAVKEVLKAEFGGRPINEQNLTHWKQGGYRDWLRKEEALAIISGVTCEAGEMQEKAGGSITEPLALWASAQYAVATKMLSAGKPNRKSYWKLLREFSEDVVKLRRGDQEAARLKLIERQIDLNERAEIAKNDRNMNFIFEVLFSAARKDAKVGAALDSLIEALQAAKIKTGPAPAPKFSNTELNQIKPNQATPPPEPPPPSSSGPA